MTSGYSVRTDLHEERMGNDLMLFDPAADRVHVLNSTSAFIWGCLKEGLDAEAVAQRIMETYDLGPGMSAKEIVEDSIGQFEKKELILKKDD